MQTRYPFKELEDKIYQLWEKGGYFKPDFGKKGPSRKTDLKKGGRFCIIMPPPNANAPLHIGHAVFVTLEDIMIRYHRMKGKTTLWLPGADHAGFETQVVFEKQLEKKGQSRFQFSREVLYKMIWDFTQKNKKVMEGQLKKLGASCDWSREKFTLDPDIIKIVYQTFEKLFDDGLIYRGKRVINWCVKHQTSLSDLEVKYEERIDPLFYIKYGPIELATVRPETKFGDTAIAVNPKDKRYKKYLGKEIEIKTLLGPAKIKVIADETIDMEFGTGAVKITPAHDAADFEVWQRHKSEIPGPKIVIDKFGRLNKRAGQYKGLKVKEARQKIAEDMAKKGLLNPSKTDHNYKHNVAVCYKCGTTIEPLISDQLFIKIKPLAEKAMTAVKKGEVKFTSKHFEKIFFHWLKNIKDWNISRQIVWGIKIPLWYCQEKKNKKCRDKNGLIVSDKKIKQCPYCRGEKLIEETDTFDTWFSSGQWPFATLLSQSRSSLKLKVQSSKFRKNIFNYTTSDFETFYPTSVMETGWDILFFWVVRMIILGIYMTGRVPFKHIYLHGLVRDKDRQKMSKSKGNVIDPLGVVELYGADALRMALVFGTSAQKDIIMSEDKIAAQQRFVTKIWNASRFILGNLDKNFNPSKIRQQNLRLTKNDKWILKELKNTTKKAAKDIEEFHFHRAAEETYHFFWHKFCDKTLEDVKKRLYSKTSTLKDRQTSQWVIYNVLVDSLKLLHPFMPFITEAVYQKLPHKPKKALIIEDWPK